VTEKTSSLHPLGLGSLRATRCGLGDLPALVALQDLAARLAEAEVPAVIERDNAER
jgi:hypothetical protein